MIKTYKKSNRQPCHCRSNSWFLIAWNLTSCAGLVVLFIKSNIPLLLIEFIWLLYKVWWSSRSLIKVTNIYTYQLCTNNYFIFFSSKNDGNKFSLELSICHHPNEPQSHRELTCPLTQNIQKFMLYSSPQIVYFE